MEQLSEENTLLRQLLQVCGCTQKEASGSPPVCTLPVRSLPSVSRPGAGLAGGAPAQAAQALVPGEMIDRFSEELAACYRSGKAKPERLPAQAFPSGGAAQQPLRAAAAAACDVDPGVLASFRLPEDEAKTMDALVELDRCYLEFQDCCSAIDQGGAPLCQMLWELHQHGHGRLAAEGTALWQRLGRSLASAVAVATVGTPLCGSVAWEEEETARVSSSSWSSPCSLPGGLAAKVTPSPQLKEDVEWLLQRLTKQMSCDAVAGGGPKGPVVADAASKPGERETAPPPPPPRAVAAPWPERDEMIDSHRTTVSFGQAQAGRSAWYPGRGVVGDPEAMIVATPVQTDASSEVQATISGGSGHAAPLPPERLAPARPRPPPAMPSPPSSWPGEPQADLDPLSLRQPHPRHLPREVFQPQPPPPLRRGSDSSSVGCSSRLCASTAASRGKYRDVTPPRSASQSRRATVPAIGSAAKRLPPPPGRREQGSFRGSSADRRPSSTGGARRRSENDLRR